MVLLGSEEPKPLRCIAWRVTRWSDKSLQETKWEHSASNHYSFVGFFFFINPLSLTYHKRTYSPEDFIRILMEYINVHQRKLITEKLHFFFNNRTMSVNIWIMLITYLKNLKFRMLRRNLTFLWVGDWGLGGGAMSLRYIVSQGTLSLRAITCPC